MKCAEDVYFNYSRIKHTLFVHDIIEWIELYHVCKKKLIVLL